MEVRRETMRKKWKGSSTSHLTFLVYGVPQHWPIISQNLVTTYAAVLVADNTLIQHDFFFLSGMLRSAILYYDDWTIYDPPIAIIFIPFGLLLSQVIANSSIQYHPFRLHSIL